MILSDHYSTLRQRGESVALALLCLLLAPVATAQVFSLEEPAFEVLAKSADYELRSYRPMVVAEVVVQGDITVAGKEGARLVKDYIFRQGAITGWAYVLAPASIIHSWVEIWFDGRWVNLEGFILDESYLIALQQTFPAAKEFCGFGAAVTDLRDPPVQWKGTDTYIQKEGINADFGIFNSPDEFYRKHGTNLSGLKKWVFETVVRAQMNRNVERIRLSKENR